MTSVTLVVILVSLLSSPLAPANQAASVPPSLTFEVASVKMSPPTDSYVWKITGGPGTNSPGQFSCANAPLSSLLLKAFELRPDQLIGPDSLDADRFDILAKIPAESTKHQVNDMLKTLLFERMDLIAHTELRSLPAYELVVAKRGLKMKPAEQSRDKVAPKTVSPGFPPKISIGSNGLPTIPAGAPMWIEIPEGRSLQLVAKMQTLSAIAKLLEARLKQPVTDHTGLSGTYDFTLLYSNHLIQTPRQPLPDSPASRMADIAVLDPVPDLLSAVESQLGLKLQMKKVPATVLVVDRYRRTLTAN